MSLKEQVTPHKLSLLILVKEFCILRQRVRSHSEVLPSGPVMVTATPESETPKPGSEATPGGQDQKLDMSESSATAETPAVAESQMTAFMISFLKLMQSHDLEPEELARQLQTFCCSELYQTFLKKLSSMTEDGLQAMMNFFQTMKNDFVSSSNPLAEKTSVVGLFMRRLIICFELMTFSQVTSLFCSFKAYCKRFLSDNEEHSMDDSMDQSMDCTGDITIPEMDTTKIKTKSRAHYSARQAELFILQQSNLLQHNPNMALRPAELQNKLNELVSANPALADVHYLSYLNHLRVNEYCGAVHSLYHYFDRNQFQKREEKDDDIVSKSYRYAILNLASLHFRFGHREEALLALEEAMRVAHEYNDHVCLQHTLSWFNRLGVEMPLKSLSLEKTVHSTEPHVPYLSSLNALVMTKRLAVDGSSPARVLERLTESDLVNCQHDLTDLTQMNLAQKTAVWSMYGNRLLPSLYSQISQNLVNYDSGVEVQGESGCIAMCTLARAFGDIGQFSSGFSILNQCKSHYPDASPHSSIWRLTEHILLYDQAFHQSQFTKMNDAVQKIQTMDPIEGLYRKALYLKEVGDTSESMAIINDLRHRDLTDHPAMFCRVTLVHTELCCQIGNPVGAVDSLVSCLVSCKEKHLLYYETLASMYLAYVQFCLSLPDQASRIIDENLVTILNVASSHDKARCLYLYARCRVAASTDHDNRKDVLQSVRVYLNQSAALFQTVCNHRRLKDVYYYQARLCHELGLIGERNKFAIEFKKLDVLYPTITQMTVNIL